MIEKIIMAVLVSIVTVVAYSASVLAVAAYLRKNGERYKEVE